MCDYMHTLTKCGHVTNEDLKSVQIIRKFISSYVDVMNN
jgi:hypothetical protein